SSAEHGLIVDAKREARARAELVLQGVATIGGIAVLVGDQGDSVGRHAGTGGQAGLNRVDRGAVETHQHVVVFLGFAGFVLIPQPHVYGQPVGDANIVLNVAGIVVHEEKCV